MFTLMKVSAKQCIHVMRQGYLTNVQLHTQLCVGTCSPVQVDPMRECSNVNRVFARDGNSSVNLASQGHCAWVFIGI
jgi:hypothetical protein